MRWFFGLVVILLTGVVFAHAELERATLEDGAVLTDMPTEVALIFSEGVEVPFSIFKVYPLDVELDPLAEDAALRLNGLAGQLVSEVLVTEGDEAVRADTGMAVDQNSGETLILPLKSALEPGTYVVMWRVLSIDSHTTDGYYTFTVASNASA